MTEGETVVHTASLAVVGSVCPLSGFDWRASINDIRQVNVNIFSASQFDS